MTAPHHGQAVTPPPGLAAWLLTHARDDALHGRPVPAWLTAYIRTLLNPAPTFPSEHVFDQPETLEISTADMATRTGYTVQHIRRLCRTGHLTARRAGRDWLIQVKENHAEDHTEGAA
ncbi:hypothetical protein GCM10017673_33960 [Streptosporangium violaceochromogenes]|nr:hypothetical protein GCM10017673_33960 [Streptosporangium violaceochromogenes]